LSTAQEAPQQLVTIRNSERTTWRRCRQKWHWSYRKGLEPKKVGTALTFGSMAHKALELWYPPGTERGIHPAETMSALIDEHHELFSQWDEDGNKVPASELGLAMMNGYVDEYGLDKKIEIIHPEELFQIDVYDRKGRYLCTMVGQFDALGINLRTGRMIILEHKTAKTIEQVRLNSQYGEQGLSYWWSATLWLRHKGFLKADQFIDGILYNFLRKGLADDRAKDPMGRALNKPGKDALKAACATAGLPISGTMEALTDRLMLEGGFSEMEIAELGEVSKVQPSPLFHRQEVPLDPVHMDMFYKRLQRECREIVLAKNGRLDIYKNPTRDCAWDCSFRDVCEVHEMGQDFSMMLEFDFKKWDPYQDHYLELENA